MCSVLLKTAAEQLCLILIEFVLLTIQWCTAPLVEGHRTTVCYGFEKPFLSKVFTSRLPLIVTCILPSVVVQLNLVLEFGFSLLKTSDLRSGTAEKAS